MNKKTLGVWENDPYFINYVWQTQKNNCLHKQQISVQCTPTCQNRGNFLANYDVVSSLDRERFLSNYYFVQLVAMQDVENWAQIIEDTINLKILDILIDENKTEFTQKDYFLTVLSPVQLIFENALIVDAWRFNAVLKNDIFELSINDLFPRYYTVEAFARIEENNWIDVWTKQYLEAIAN